MLSQIDHDILLRLNSITVYNALFPKLFYAIGLNPLIRGFPVLFPLAILWFYDDYDKRRSRLLIGLLTTCLVVFLSVWIQFHVNIHTRPFLDQTLPIYDRRAAENWDRLSSFPSDTATLYFSLVTIIFLERPLWGSLALLWSLVTVGLVRVALGWHYPSDIVGALVLGPGCVYLISKIKYLGLLSERFLYIFRSGTYIIHSMFVIFVADAYNSFAGLSGIAHILKTATERLIKSS
jgi:membrane-associated phospholipid phosphatase